ncbi:site-2 protease family protein [Kovacikia minuta CCNUW1]|uniref:site-2 protease family protein n=1 Tax=Kovacikia minuta TaxID=2931930 RepID=UPI001CCC68AD|nr:site-2 protease family protein [Kovacikia minuta]UBF29183.1 site-2 protease family protein [Kovacikia minuta CCNUW1]
MQSGWRVGSLFGIPLYIDPSWFVIIVLVAIPRGLLWQRQYPDWGIFTAYTAGVLMALLLFASVLLHELGHSVVAKTQGIKVNSITLFLFGGIASIEQESKTPGKAFQVAIAGPVVSIGLFVLLSILALVIPGSTNPVNVLATNLAVINLVLALFNLIPGLPLDGGQILKAAVWKITGDRFKGVHWAARMGRILGWFAILLGLFLFLVQNDYGGLWIAFLGWFGVQNASSYDRVTHLQEILLQLKASDAITREFRVVDANMTLRQFADQYLLESSRPMVYFAASDGRYRGLVATDDLNYVERSQWETETLFRIIQPLTDIPTVEEPTRLVDVIQRMEQQQLRRITVLSPAGAVSGVIDRGDIVQAIAKKMNLPVSDALIKQIKEEGAYPPGFQLGPIAQAAAEASGSPSS